MPDTRRSHSTVSRAVAGFQHLSEYQVSAVPSFQAGASAESQGDKGDRVREWVRVLLAEDSHSCHPGRAVEASTSHFSLMLSSQLEMQFSREAISHHILKKATY